MFDRSMVSYQVHIEFQRGNFSVNSKIQMFLTIVYEIVHYYFDICLLLTNIKSLSK